jgi:hypothetical protein
MENKQNGWNDESAKQKYNTAKREVHKAIKKRVKEYELSIAEKAKKNPKIL